MTSRKDRKEEPLSRHQFIKRTAATCFAAVGATLLGSAFYSDKPLRRSSEEIFEIKDFSPESSPVLPEMVAVRGEDPKKITRAAIDALGGITRFIRPGEKVLIKPNVGWDRQPELAATTNPDVIQAVVEMCREARAGAIWVSDVSINDSQRSFARSGIESAVHNGGGVIKHVSHSDFVTADLKGDLLKIWPVARYIFNADRVINIPVVKHHSLSGCTIAMKNWYGMLGGKRNRLHQNIHQSICDLSAAFRPTLTVVDAVRVLKRNGPTGGRISDVASENTVIAGLNEPALDGYALGFLGQKREDLSYFKLAFERGLGDGNWRNLRYLEKRV